MARRPKQPRRVHPMVADAQRELAAARERATAVSRETLRSACAALVSGYAHDLCDAIADGNGGSQDDDSLFRSLILDHGWSVTDATPVFEAAAELLSPPAGF